jgi:hypothetical protein
VRARPRSVARLSARPIGLSHDAARCELSRITDLLEKRIDPADGESEATKVKQNKVVAAGREYGDASR